MSWVNNVQIRCENPNISYTESIKEERIDKCINFNKLYHLDPKLNEKKFGARDYIFPFMTQIIVKYEDTNSG